MDNQQPFTGYSIVACGTMRPELERLRDDGFLEADSLLFTAPGLHEDCKELKRQLLQQLDRATQTSPRVIVVYGSKCYIDSQDMSRSLDDLLAEHPGSISRTKAANCVDMLASKPERDAIAAGQPVYWLTTGWLKYWKAIFKKWSHAEANETFPKHDKAILLDPLGTYEHYVETAPQELLEFADWMNLPIEPHEVTLERLKALLIQEVENRSQAETS